MAEWTSRPTESKDYAEASFSFSYMVNGQQRWAGGKYGSFLESSETEDDLMERCEANAHTIALSVRDRDVAHTTQERAHQRAQQQRAQEKQ